MDMRQPEAAGHGTARGGSMRLAALERTPPDGRFDAHAWLTYFVANAAQCPPLRWDTVLTLDVRLRGPLARSLQRFQVGEQGDGLHLRAAAARTHDVAYAQAIDLFVREEQGHSRLLAQALARLGAPPLLPHHWSNTCFVLLRRCAGLRLELLVLLTAEIIAQHYYPALRDGVGDDATLRAVFAQIAEDEEGHVAFHCAYLRSALAPLPRMAQSAIRGGWRLLFRTTCLAVLLDHWGALRAVAETPIGFWRACGRCFDRAATWIFAPDAEADGATR